MKKILSYLTVELIISLFFTALSNELVLNRDFLTLFGLLNLIVGFAFSLLALLLTITKNTRSVDAILAASGIILLIGAATCTAFPFKFYG